MNKLIVLILGFLIGFSAPLVAVESILVLPCNSDEANVALAQTITDMMVSTVHASGFISTSTEARLKALKELEFGLSGLANESTLLKIGEMTQATSVLQGTLLVNGGMWYLTISQIEVENAQVKTSFTETYRSAASLLEGCPGQVRRCLGVQVAMDDQRVISVKNTTELLQAIGPDRIIRLSPGNYDLSPGFAVKNKYISWVNDYDGPCPIIKSVQNLTIIGDSQAVVMIQPAYGWVLSFENCTGLTLSGLVIGHTVPGECMGGVVRLKNCSDVEIRDCELYGSGTYGLEFERTSNLLVENCLVRNCTFGLAIVKNSSQISFIGTIFKETGEYDLFEISTSDHLLWSNCHFQDNRGDTFFLIDDSSRDLQLNNCTFLDNQVRQFSNLAKSLELNNTTF